MIPRADIPVVQLSIDERQPAEYHFEVGKRLIPLRDEEVLIVGSGNLVHNLHAYAWGRHAAEPFEWAARFEDKARELLLAGSDYTANAIHQSFILTAGSPYLSKPFGPGSLARKVREVLDGK